MSIPLSSTKSEVLERYVVRLHSGAFISKIFSDKLGTARDIDSAKLIANRHVAAYLARTYQGDVITVLVDEHLRNARICTRHEAEEEWRTVPIPNSTVETLKQIESVYSGADLSHEVERAL